MISLDLAAFKDCHQYPQVSVLNNSALAHIQPGAKFQIDQIVNPTGETLNFCFMGTSALENIEIRDWAWDKMHSYNATAKISLSDSNVTAASFYKLESLDSTIEESTFYELTASQSIISNSDIEYGIIHDATISQVAAELVTINDNSFHTFHDVNGHVELQSASAKHFSIMNKGNNVTIGSPTDPFICSGYFAYKNNATTPIFLNSVEASKYCTIVPGFKPLPIPPAYIPPIVPSQNPSTSSHFISPIIVLGSLGISTFVFALCVLHKCIKSRSDNVQINAPVAESEMVSLNTSNNSSALLI